LEFYDIFLLTLFLKEGHHLKDEEMLNKANISLNRIESYQKQVVEDLEDATENGPKMAWPYSQKDYMFDHLSVERARREEELLVHKQKKVEREEEEREIVLMEKEDVDVYSEHIKPSSSSHHHHSSNPESRIDVESYNDF